ncbi:hypothetical protein CLV55_10382 [Flavobacterium aciduliphilum]|uniref:Uncharacterized protein n=2 Tax=Flavobacterium aciduliphilum TaxID=1101402 RepID=A0A328YKZ5_9FLAO|nr:hypothetical protein CLV55_10382 [Flavobacterium aciduliphilum]
MARISIKPKPEHLQFLKKELIKKHGYSIINTIDCDWLSNKMNNKVSSDTLRRLFNVVKNDTTLSINSLNYCAEFCGHSDWGKFIEYYNQVAIDEFKYLLLKSLESDLETSLIIKKIESLKVNKEVYDLFIQIILIKALQKDETFFQNFFEFETLFVDIENNRYSVYFILQLLTTLCIKNEWIQKIACKYYYNLDKTYAFENDFFVEWVVTPQFEFYRTLLNQYYKLKKDNLSTHAFYHLILASYYANINDWKSFDSHYKDIQKINFSEIDANILLMRKKGVSLLYAKKYQPVLIEQLINDIKSIKFDLEYTDISDRITSLLIICLYLHQCKEYEIITHLAQKYIPTYNLLFTQWGEQNWNHFKILQTDSLLKTNQLEKAKDLFKSISNTNYDFNFSPITDTIYKNLEKELNKS